MSSSPSLPILPVLTQQKKISFLWIMLINLSWFVGLYTIFVIGTTMPFTVRRFTSDTRVMALVSTIGLWFGIILGPLVNYVSDRIWTRFGRRRPFLLIATCGSLMACLCVPFMPSLSLLMLVVVVSSILGDVGTTQEPLWLEVIPPAQRGTAFAIRSMLSTLASLLFFQLMFAQFERKYTLPGGFILTGEQTCYLSAALLQLLYLIFLAFFIREIRPEGVNLANLSEVRSDRLVGIIRSTFGETEWWHYLFLCPLPVPIMLQLAARPNWGWINALVFPTAFTVKYVIDVFGEIRWWWIYLFYVTQVFVTAGGSFGTLMLVEQFKFSTFNIAMSGFPEMILSLCALTPFMAWYADRLPRFPPLLLCGTLLGSLGALYSFMQKWHDLQRVELPPFWAMMIIAVLVQLAAVAAVIWCFQTLKALTPRTNPRLWAWMLCGVSTYSMVVVTYLAIKAFSPGQLPSFTLWFILSHIRAGVICLGVVAGPLLYDFMPKDKIGTLSSGFGLLSTLLNAALGLLAGWWIRRVSLWLSHGENANDYTTALTMQMTLGFFTLALTAIFVIRMLKGTMVEYGRLGLNSTQTPPPPLPVRVQPL